MPTLQSKTPLPQTWHVPQCTSGLTPKPEDNVTIQKLNHVARMTLWDLHWNPPKSWWREWRRGSFPSLIVQFDEQSIISFPNSSTEGVKGVPNDAQILQIVPTPLDPIQTKLANSKFGEVSYGSVLSYKQRVDTNSLDIINISDAPPFPFFPLPVQPHYHIALTRAQQKSFDGLQTTFDQSKENWNPNKRAMSNSEWHALWSKSFSAKLWRATLGQDFFKFFDSPKSSQELLDSLTEYSNRDDGLPFYLHVHLLPFPPKNSSTVEVSGLLQANEVPMQKLMANLPMSRCWFLWGWAQFFANCFGKDGSVSTSLHYSNAKMGVRQGQWPCSTCWWEFHEVMASWYVSKIFLGHDLCVRTAEVKTKDTTLVRPISKLVLLTAVWWWMDTSWLTDSVALAFSSTTLFSLLNSV